MKYVGPHVSIAGGVERAPYNAKELEATGFGLFTKNQRQWEAPLLTPEQIDKFQKAMEECSYTPDQVLPHDSYLINLGHPEKEKWEKSLSAFFDEAKRVELLGLKYLNFHPGSHLNQIPKEESIKKIAEAINRTHDKYPSVTLLIETTAGQGSSIGYRFEELAAIIDPVNDKARVGICVDTCHIFAAGYDIRTKAGYQAVMREFDSTIGLSYLKAMHLNDAKSEFESRVDRHHSIGKGNLGVEPFQFIMNDPLLDEIPLILETIDSSLWKEEVKLLLSM